MTTTSTTAALIGVRGSPLDRLRFPLGYGYLVIGRERPCWLVLDDPLVSPRHAALTSNGEVWVEDLSSGGGTWVNNERISASQRLLPGDVLRIPPFAWRFEPAEPVPEPAPDLTAGEQNAGMINNVVGNQYIQRRDSLLREIAATRTRGWRLIIFGFLMYVTGAGLFAAAIMGALSQTGSGRWRPPSNPFGVPVFGVPSGVIGWGLAGVGTVLVVIGIVLHVVAVARRHRVDRDLPAPGGARR